MRIRTLLHGVLLLLTLFFPVFARAQFQPPTDAELKMTSDPKAPGAAAVYLYREETTDDILHFHSYYERIKVLAEKGKELATIRVPYEPGQFKVTGIKGRTIHPDGTIVPLTTRPDDLMDIKNGKSQVNTMVFTLPSVEVGSILEYRLELRYDDNIVSSPTWHIQQPYFVHKAHYMFRAVDVNSAWRSITNDRGQHLGQLMYAVTSLPLDSVVQNVSGRYTVDLTDIPPTPHEDWMPPLNTINKRVEFYYTYAHTGEDFWDSEGKLWARETGDFTTPTSLLKKTVAEIVAPTDTDEQKARKIYAAVLKLDNTNFSRIKSEAERKAEKIKSIKNAEDVWKQQSGSSDEITLLYIALGRAANLKVWPVEVTDRSRALFDPRFLDSSQLDDYLVEVEIAGKSILLDPGQKMCTFGQVHWKHGLASGFHLAANGPSLSTTPAVLYKTAVTKRIADLRINADGSMKGTVRIAMTGPEALHWRQLALQNDPEEIRERFDEHIHNEVPDGVQVETDHFIGLDDPDVNLLAIVNVNGNMGTATGKRLFLPGLFFESRSKHPFVAEDKRTAPIDVQYAKAVQDDVTYHLPAGFTAESAPQTTDIQWPDHAFLKILSLPADGAVKVKRLLIYNFTLLTPDNYTELHNFYQKTATADQQQLVLMRSPIAKGN